MPFSGPEESRAGRASPEPLPGTESAAGLRLVGHSTLGGNGDGMQVLRHRDALYVGHAGRSGIGTSILDVSDPAAPRLVDQWPAPAGSRCPKVQVAGDLLLVNEERHPPRVDGIDTGTLPDTFSAGLIVYDVSEPFRPQRIGYLDLAATGGEGVHRTVWTGGRYAHASIFVDGRMDWLVIDLGDPTRPVEAARWRLDEPVPAGEHWIAHHALVEGRHAYLGYGDAGLVVLDVADFRRPRLVGRLAWGGRHTHTCLPLPGRSLVVATDEAVTDRCAGGRVYVSLIDVSDPVAPRFVARCPEPAGDFCERGLRFGPHNLHENRPGSYCSARLVFATYFNAGLRVYNLSDAEHPVEVAHWLPEAPPGQAAPQANDLFVESGGRIWVTDRVGGGLYALEPDPELASLMGELALPAGSGG